MAMRPPPRKFLEEMLALARADVKRADQHIALLRELLAAKERNEKTMLSVIETFETLLKAHGIELSMTITAAGETKH